MRSQITSNAPVSAFRYIRAAAHLGCFVQRKGGVLSDIDLNILDSFSVKKSPAHPALQSAASQVVSLQRIPQHR
jgi:hypothetical protein